MTPKSENLFYGTIFAITGIAIVLGVVFYSGYSAVNWSFMIVLTVLMFYLQTVVVRIGERMDYSLATAAMLPVIFLYGVTPSMLISALSGIYDGIKHKKEWRRTMFNAAQFAICALLASLSFGYLTNLLGNQGFGLAVAMSAGTAVYIVCNIAFVSLLVAIWRGVSLFTQIKLLNAGVFYNNFSTGFVGVIFSFFVLSYGIWGLLAFSGLLLNLSWLLNAAAVVSTERARRQALEEALVVDEMTGAYNFRYLNNWLSEPSDVNMAVLFLDIDDFCIFNNKYGHAEGDKVLKILVDTINKSVRSADRVIRYGGDEFVVFLNEMDTQGARRVAQRIMENLDSLTDVHLTESITVSIGIATKPYDTKDKHQLLLFADQAMYMAKDKGKNTLQVWSAVKDPA